VLEAMRPYVEIARADHWFKNAFMLLGVLLAFFYEPHLARAAALPAIGLALLATCLVASSNYVLNELLDAPTDLLHPEKKHRPVPSGKVRPAIAYCEWIALGAAGIALALEMNRPFAASAGALWVMGVAYNVPPLRTKEWPYVDVLTESANNPIRLLLGWFAVTTARFPPVSLAISYWMLGAFFMATKRFAEFRHLADRSVAASYRRSFRHYTEESLLLSMTFYATACAFFAGIFIVRYHLELILFVPFAAGMFAYYLKLGLRPNSPVQRPETLYRERGFLIYTVACLVLFVALMFTEIPTLYSLFHVEPSRAEPLWRLGGEAGIRPR
jgi:4-hydroxybenzoate polyprenyltransferase